MAEILKRHFELLADYHQFYLQDESVKGDLSESWTPDATKRLLAVAPGTIGVGTVRNRKVSVDVEVHVAEPVESFDEWDQVNDCSIEICSGRIVVAGCTDYFPDAARIDVPPAIYRARVLYGNLGSVSDDGLEGQDRYRVVLWSGNTLAPTVLKQRQGES
ncbi:MAG TPA: hypothetical protein VGG19_02450 [Tepidisphaeraceae bacterium]|jgi:hypothetical protein